MSARIAFIPFYGGPSPLPAGSTYDALHRDGSVSENREAWPLDRWDHYGTPCDIVGYRLRESCSAGVSHG